MALMHFVAQMGMVRLGPFLISMPDEMEEIDRIAFTEHFRDFEHAPEAFKNEFVGLSNSDIIAKVEIMAEAFMNYRYPKPRDQVFTSFHAATFTHKDFYLPALKVLNFKDGEFYSPARTAKWKNLELKAEHLVVDMDLGKGKYFVTKAQMKHKVDMVCDCGIYGSVNVEELGTYYHYTRDTGMIQMDPNFTKADRRLVIVEPSNDAGVFLARKGWKATRAFISEIVGDTMSIQDASEMLSMVWQRRIDVNQVFVGRVIE